MGLLSNLVANISTSTLAWDLGTALENAVTTLQKWGKWIVILIGVVMILIGAYQIAKGFISHGKQQTNWVVAILLLIVGGAFMVGGFTWLAGIAQGGKKTIEDLGGGDPGTTIIPFLSSFLF